MAAQEACLLLGKITHRRRQTALNVLVTICVTGLLVMGTPTDTHARKVTHEVSTEKGASLVELINRERSDAGLPELVFCDDLAKVAELHAVDMIESEYFGHVSPTIGTLAARLKSADVAFSKAGENLAGCTSVALAHDLLMASSSHKANILSRRFTKIGVAVVEGGLYGMMIVEVFVSETAESKQIEQVP